MAPRVLYLLHNSTTHHYNNIPLPLFSPSLTSFRSPSFVRSAQRRFGAPGSLHCWWEEEGRGGKSKSRKRVCVRRNLLHYLNSSSYPYTSSAYASASAAAFESKTLPLLLLLRHKAPFSPHSASSIRQTKAAAAADGLHPLLLFLFLLFSSFHPPSPSFSSTLTLPLFSPSSSQEG